MGGGSEDPYWGSRERIDRYTRGISRGVLDQGRFSSKSLHVGVVRDFTVDGANMDGSWHAVLRSELVWMMDEWNIGQLDGAAGRSKHATTTSELIRAREE